jgi:hypothetical protein
VEEPSWHRVGEAGSNSSWEIGQTPIHFDGSLYGRTPAYMDTGRLTI